jgi:hypothetical protein
VAGQQHVVDADERHRGAECVDRFVTLEPDLHVVEARPKQPVTGGGRRQIEVPAQHDRLILRNASQPFLSQ